MPPEALRGAEGAASSHRPDETGRAAGSLTLAQSEARYRLLATNASDVITCQSPAGLLTFVSPSASAVLGYDPEEMIGTPPSDYIHPDDLGPNREILGRHLATPDRGNAFRLEYRAIRKDGSIIWVESQNRPIFDPATGELIEYLDVARDITARKAAESALAASERRHSVIADNATDIIARSSPSGRLLYVSPSIRAVTGYDFDELAGHKPAFLKCIHPDDLGPSIAHVQTILRGEPVENTRLSYRFRHKDGRWIWLECSPTIIREANGAAVEILDVIRDVTAHKQLQQELQAARAEAERAARVKADFMANMSHEIRTPLTAILGFTNLLAERSDVGAEAQVHVGRVATAGQALLAIVNDILDFSKLEAGQVQIDPIPVSPGKVLRDAMSLLSGQADAKGLRFEIEGDDGLPAAVRIDPHRVRQILLNLLGNAIKFTDSGVVRLVASHDADTEHLLVRVEDTGAGLSENQVSRLFQRFSQVDASSTRRHGGTGLGLAICRGLVEAMGGDISVSSRLGHGSVFKFRVAAPVAEIFEAPHNADGRTIEDLSYLRVLVIDDNIVNRELARAVLESLGAEVTEAEDGLAGLERALAEPVDIILLDVRMPGLDGPAVLARLRTQDGPNQDIPVLAFTADANLDRHGGPHRFDGVVRKPMSANDIAAAIHAVLAADHDLDPDDVRTDAAA